MIEEKLNEGHITKFFRKNTRSTTPIFVAGFIAVGVPMLTQFNSDLKHLGMSKEFNWYEFSQALVSMCIIGLASLGGFMSSHYKDWKDEKKQQEKDKI